MAKEWSFVAFKLPGSSIVEGYIQREPCDIVQYSNDADMASGFIIAPFDLRGPDKTYCIRPDIRFSFKGDKADLIGGDISFLIDFSNSEEKPKKWHTSEMCEEESLDEKSYLELVALAKESITRGELKKVVISRQLEHPIGTDFSPTGTFKELCSRYPEMFCCLISTPGTGTWIGASPELLLQIERDNFSTVALAGTRGSSLFKERWGQKELEEQAWVSSYLSETMQKNGMRNIESHGPFTMQAGNLEHLKTTFSARLTQASSFSHLMETFHPTPAVCGTPKNNARDFILKHEEHFRSYYSGFWGVMNKKNQCSLFVNLRCMKILSDRAFLYVGGGITKSSIAKNEWQETELKAQTLLSILKS